MSTERDYVLGTHDEEVSRLGLQHRVWRPVVLDCWSRSGITAGSRVLDVGAGPGYAAIDLAEIVGPTGQVTAIERSNKFINVLTETCQSRGLTNIDTHEVDLMTGDLPPGSYDFSWCRWVLCFVPEPETVVRKIAGAMRKGGIALFHEYGWYKTWSYVPPRPYQQQFVDHIMASWRETGGNADVGLDLPVLLQKHGFRLRSVRPHIFAIRPSDYMWQWPAVFINGGPARLEELGRIDKSFSEKLRAELAEAESSPDSLMLTPLVLEIAAEKG